MGVRYIRIPWNPSVIILESNIVSIYTQPSGYGDEKVDIGILTVAGVQYSSVDVIGHHTGVTESQAMEWASEVMCE